MDEGLRNKAYLEASRLKRSGLDNEVIYARLEKQGIPPDIINRVIQNINLQNVADQTNERQEHYEVKSNTYLFKAGAGILLGIISYFMFPDTPIIPIGCVVGGICLAIFYKVKA